LDRPPEAGPKSLTPQLLLNFLTSHYRRHRRRARLLGSPSTITAAANRTSFSPPSADSGYSIRPYRIGAHFLAGINLLWAYL